MKIKNSVWAGSIGRLMLAICLMVTLSSVATAWDITASSITVPDGTHGRMIFSIVDQYNNTVAGGSLPEGATTGTIRGVPGGSYTLNAFVDTTGTGYQHANDPTFSTPIFVSGNYSGAAVFTTPAPVATAAPDPEQGNFDVMPLDGAAFVGFTPDGSDNNLPTADRHTLYWSTAGNPGPDQPEGTGGSLVITSKDPKIVIYNLANGTEYFFAVRAENTVNQPISDVVGQIVPAAQPVSASTVNVTVDTTGITKNTPQPTPLIVIVTDNNDAFYFGYIMSPADIQTVPITGVQAGTYLIYTILDLSGTGNIDDPRNASNMNGADRNQRPLPVVVDGISATITAPTTRLAEKKAGVAVNTYHSRQNGLESFGLSFYVAPMSSKQLFNVTLKDGPQISGPIDMGLDNDNDGNGSYGLSVQVPDRPVVGDTYTFSLFFDTDDPLKAEDWTGKVTAVLDNFPGNTFPVDETGPDSVSPTFGWTNPGNLPGFVFTSISLNNNGIDFLPMSVLSATPPEGTSFPVGQMHQWNRSVEDLDGNQAQQSMSFTPNASGPVISDFTPKNGAGGVQVVITGSGFSCTPSNNTIKFNGVSVSGVTVSQTTNPCDTLTVTAPASSGVITVTVGGITAGSSDVFNATTAFTGAAQDNTGANLSGVAIALAENPTVSIGTSDTTDTGSPNYGVPVPARPYFSLLFTKSGYYPTYTALMSINPGGTSTGNWSVYTSLELTGRSVLPVSGKGVIIGRVQDWTNGSSTNLGGAVVTATSLIHPDVPYVVKYTNGTTIAQDPAVVTQTDSNGRFYVVDVDEGDYVTVTASKAGMGFQNRVFNTHGDAVSSHSVRGATPGTPSASPTSGAYATAQSVTLSAPTAAPNVPATDNILYTTNGNDPRVFGSTYSGSIPVSADMTLKFVTVNKYVGVVFSPVQTEVYSIGASISGQVTDANTASPLQFVNVQLYDQNGFFLNSTNSDFSGNYRFSGLTANTYKVCFYTGQGYISQCWQNTAATPSSATPIPVSTSPVTGIDAALQIGAIITGTVTNGTSGIQNVWVNVYDNSGFPAPGIGGAMTDESGNYALSGLPTGTYKLYFNGQTPGYISQWYNNKVDAASADPVPVSVGNIYTGYNAQLFQGGSISGRVTRDGVNGIQNVNVQLRDTSGNWINGINGAMTQPDGTYTVSGIPAGSYKLYFDGSSTGYISEWFDNASDQSAAVTLVVSPTPPVTDINAVLTSGGTISGRVTSNGVNGIQNVNVQLRDTNGNGIPNIGGTFTDFNGNYSLGGLPTGSYKLYFDGSSVGYVGQWFNNTSDQSAAIALPVTAGGTPVTGINAVLLQGATISGTVINSGLAGIQDVSVQLYDSAGTMNLNNTNTGVTGGYQFGGLPGGTYKVCFTPGQTNYLPKCYNGLAYDPQNATEITVSAPGGRNDINATLTLGGGISGQVTDGSSGIQNISVEVRDTVSGNAIPGVFSMWTDFGGNYTVRGIPSGNIKVYFNPNGTGYGGQWYNGKTAFATSDTVAITAGFTSALSTAVLQSATAPGAPTITSITPGFGQAQVYFNAPASDGGLPIQDYTVTVNPGGMTGFGLGSPINVNGLTNGQNYTVSITARNNAGTGTAATTPYAQPFLVNSSDLQSVVDAVAAGGAAWAQSGPVNVSIPALLVTKGVTISGGYDPTYTSVNGYTTITGTTTGLRPGGIIIRGNSFKVIVKNVKVKAP